MPLWLPGCHRREAHAGSSLDGAVAYGVLQAAVLFFDKSGQGTQSAYRSASRGVSDLRSGKARDVRYHDEERRVQEDLRKKKVKGE